LQQADDDVVVVEKDPEFEDSGSEDDETFEERQPRPEEDTDDEWAEGENSKHRVG